MAQSPTKLVSLGSSCTPAWQIRTHLNQPEAYPFDWLVTPFDSLCRLLHDDFVRFIEPDGLEPFSSNTTIRNSRYNLLHHHDFKRTGRTMSANWMDDVPNVQSKYDYLIARWRALNSYSGRVIFVRHGGHLNECFNIEKRLSDDEVFTLLDALQRCFPILDFSVLFVTAASTKINHPRAMFAEMPFANEADWPNAVDRWKGATSKWEQLIRTL